MKIFLCCFLFLTACAFSVADSSVRIQALVVDQGNVVYQSCSLRLYQGDRLTYEIQVPGDIDMYIPVSPDFSSAYDVRVECEGSLELFKSSLIAKDIKSREAKVFGAIVLQRSIDK